MHTRCSEVCAEQPVLTSVLNYAQTALLIPRGQCHHITIVGSKGVDSFPMYTVLILITSNICYSEHAPLSHFWILRCMLGAS